MAEPPKRAWSLDEFFAWQERQQDRYEDFTAPRPAFAEACLPLAEKAP